LKVAQEMVVTSKLRIPSWAINKNARQAQTGQCIVVLFVGDTAPNRSLAIFIGSFL
jgi:hypothetical protein